MKHRLTAAEVALATLLLAFLAFASIGARSNGYFVPYDSQSDTLGIAVGDTLTRAFKITGAKRVGLYIPTIDATDIKLLACFDADSTFLQLYIPGAAGDTLKAWTLHNGTGAFTVDITRWIAGFDYFRVETGDTMTVLRTFHVTQKY